MQFWAIYTIMVAAGAAALTEIWSELQTRRVPPNVLSNY
jgi:hypothetical protein